MDRQILDTPPKGYIPLKNATTAPIGTQWYWNGKPIFDGQYHAVLVKQEVENGQ